MARDNPETQNFDKKSLKILDQNNEEGISKSSAKDLAKDCVCFANGKGGIIVIGIENNAALPPSNQIIEELELPQKLERKISSLTHNVHVRAGIKRMENGGEVIELRIFKSESTIASTNDGKYYVRSSDSCVPVLPEELTRLLNDKPSFIWEKRRTKALIDRADSKKLRNFILDVKNSEKISKHVKEKSDDEILEHYFLTEDGFLTNLGVLWIGSRNDRSNLSYSPIIHFIKYDEKDQKVKKEVWDYDLNPKEMIDAVLNLPEWFEGIEIPDGMFRKFIPNYDKNIVIRELLVNAIAHRPYTQRGEILISLFPDRLEIKNPGLFPIGVTPENFLHKSVRRNEKLAKLMSDLGMMEQEGSGIDKIYEVLLSNGKAIPKASQDDDSVSIQVKKRIINSEVIGLIERANKEFQLKSRELISLGLIAENNSLSAIEFGKKLGLSKQSNYTHQWLGGLLDLEIIKSKGKTKALEYFVNPDFLKKSNFRGKTNLKNIENHRLEELIYQDIKVYQPTAVSNIHQRIGQEIPLTKLRSMLSLMIKKRSITKTGERRWVKYLLAQNQ